MELHSTPVICIFKAAELHSTPVITMPYGQALAMPGFCYNRVVDFVCYLWIAPQSNYPDYYDMSAEEGWGMELPDYTGYDDNGYDMLEGIVKTFPIFTLVS